MQKSALKNAPKLHQRCVQSCTLCTNPKRQNPCLHYTAAFSVEVRRIELLSKHILQKLSTCLFDYWLSGNGRKTTNQSSP